MRADNSEKIRLERILAAARGEAEASADDLNWLQSELTPKKRGRKRQNKRFERGRWAFRLIKEDGVDRESAIQQVADGFGVTFCTVERDYEAFQQLRNAVTKFISVRKHEEAELRRKAERFGSLPQRVIEELHRRDLALRNLMT